MQPSPRLADVQVGAGSCCRGATGAHSKGAAGKAVREDLATQQAAGLTLPMRWLQPRHHTLKGISKRMMRMPSECSLRARSPSAPCDPWYLFRLPLLGSHPGGK